MGLLSDVQYNMIWPHSHKMGTEVPILIHIRKKEDGHLFYQEKQKSS